MFSFWGCAWSEVKCVSWFRLCTRGCCWYEGARESNWNEICEMFALKIGRRQMLAFMITSMTRILLSAGILLEPFSSSSFADNKLLSTSLLLRIVHRMKSNINRLNNRFLKFSALCFFKLIPFFFPSNCRWMRSIIPCKLSLFCLLFESKSIRLVLVSKHGRNASS